MRIYFNRHSDYPLIWSVDNGPGTEEHNVEAIYLDAVNAVTFYREESGDGTGAKGEDLLSPRAWISVIGPVELEIKGGAAVIKPAKM